MDVEYYTAFSENLLVERIRFGCMSSGERQFKEFYPPPVEVTRTEYKFRIEDLECVLRPLEMPILSEKKYEPKVITLRDGSKMVVRQVEREEADILLEAIKPYFDVKQDFYDLVAVRTYAEILAWKEYRIKDHYALIGVIDGKLVGIVNARLWDQDVAISLHTISFKRGADVGPALYFSKVEHAFENLGVKEWWATFESYIGFRVLNVEWAKRQKPWPEYQHELGGARVYYLTRDDWELLGKKKFAKYLGERPVPPELLKSAEKPRINKKPFEF